MIELYKQRIQKGDEEHTKLPSALGYTVFDDDEFIVESILSHQGDLTKNTSLLLKVQWLGDTVDFD